MTLKKAIIGRMVRIKGTRTVGELLRIEKDGRIQYGVILRRDNQGEKELRVPLSDLTTIV